MVERLEVPSRKRRGFFVSIKPEARRNAPTALSYAQSYKPARHKSRIKTKTDKEKKVA